MPGQRASKIKCLEPETRQRGRRGAVWGRTVEERKTREGPDHVGL